MARMIVLMVEDDEAIKNVLDKPPQGSTVVGSFFIPSMYCECNNLLHKDGILLNKQFTRGSKYGLYVHKDCKKPVAGHSHYPNNQLVPDRVHEGRNLSLHVRYPYDPDKPYKPFGRLK